MRFGDDDAVRRRERERGQRLCAEHEGGEQVSSHVDGDDYGKDHVAGDGACSAGRRDGSERVGEKGGESSGHAQLTNDALVDDLTDDDMEIELGMYYSDIETQGSSSDGAGRAASGLAQLANARMPHNDAPHQKGARQHQDSVADKEHQAQKDTHRSLFCQSALQRSRARRMYRSLSCRPDSVEDFCIHNDPNKCVEVKFGSMRRTWTFLDLRLELDPAAADPPGAGGTTGRRK